MLVRSDATYEEAFLQIERLEDIQAYVRRTADDLERVSRNMAGHMLYLELSARPHEAQEVSERIFGLQASVHSLRGVFGN
ncbi:hypothetical protein ALQ64_00241 [Pseudomonas cannabina]|uniref:Uncharacterized protein n=1 Tax=Pseudomonas cannabina TaxID=86840 RepID=A0A0N8QU29_PSECA|nr:Uncharacterized protein ALO81_00750 [Pseudomonas cannabina]RMN32953.1 hypothetical protein ALQ64_00241 [Pseudomonas cannabina]SDQ99881.1 hypothetical protein SAMN05216597_1918 [Pseudomonas cannabina]